MTILEGGTSLPHAIFPRRKGAVVVMFSLMVKGIFLQFVKYKLPEEHV